MKRLNVLDDNLGIAISWLFIFQCLGERVLRFLAPGFSWTVSAHTHFLLAFCVVLFGVAALAKEPLQHCNSRVKVILLPGILVVCMSAAVSYMTVPEALEIALAVVGNSLVIVAHHLNKKLIATHNTLIGIVDDEPSEPTQPAEPERHYV